MKTGLWPFVRYNIRGKAKFGCGGARPESHSLPGARQQRKAPCRLSPVGHDSSKKGNSIPAKPRKALKSLSDLKASPARVWPLPPPPSPGPVKVSLFTRG